MFKHGVKRKVLFLSGHLWQSKRRAGFHHLAEAFYREGWTVVFMTVAFSQLARIRGDYRFKQSPRYQRNKMIWEDERLAHFAWSTPWHPANFRSGIANTLLRPLVAGYAALPLGEVEPHFCDADLFVFESTPGIVLFDRVKRLNPRARTIYRVSDILRVLSVHPKILAVEQQIAPKFDLVSVPSALMVDEFPDVCRIAVHRHGLDRTRFDYVYTSPYSGNSGRCQAICVGNMLFDRSFFSIAADACADVDFHIVGAVGGLSTRPNLFLHGELPFEETIPFIKYADVGIAPYLQKEGVAYLVDSSLKMIQYTYCSLPIVAPVFAATGRPHAFSYVGGDGRSIRKAIESARAYDRSSIRHDEVRTWDEVLQDILLMV